MTIFAKNMVSNDGADSGLFADANGLRARACFRSGEIHILDSTGNIERVIPFDDTNRKL
jgi:hypothetical protein